MGLWDDYSQGNQVRNPFGTKYKNSTHLERQLTKLAGQPPASRQTDEIGGLLFLTGVWYNGTMHN